MFDALPSHAYFSIEALNRSGTELRKLKPLSRGRFVTRALPKVTTPSERGVTRNVIERDRELARCIGSAVEGRQPDKRSTG